MPVQWLHQKSPSTNEALPYSGNLLIDNFRSADLDDGRKTFNIVASDYEIATKLLESFSKFENAFQNLRIRFGWIEDERRDVSDSYISEGDSLIIGKNTDIMRFLKVPDVKTLHLSSISRNEEVHIGFQRHFKSHKNPASIALGELREDIAHSETQIRKAERIHFHIDALRREDSHSEHSHIAGLDIFQCCQLMRLAGLSPRLTLTCINVVDKDITQTTADAVALLTWYFLEGQINKEIETMKQKENDIFLVNSDLFEEPIKFVVGHKTGRWWYQNPNTKEYVPCSELDYKAILTGNLPDAICALEHA